MFKTLTLCASFFLSTVVSTTILADTLSVKIVGTQLKQGNIYIGIFKEPAQFPNGKPFQKKILTNTLQTQFTLPSGKYAIGIFQDHNKNGKLDKNFLGIPKEKYGFSGRKTFGQPNFNASAISINKNTKITIKL